MKLFIYFQWAVVITVLRIAGFRVATHAHLHGDNPHLSALASHRIFGGLRFLGRDLPPARGQGGGARLPLLVALSAMSLLVVGCMPTPVPVTTPEVMTMEVTVTTPTWTCVVYESEGQIGATTRTRSGMPHETVLVEVLGAKVVSCSEASAAPEPHCRRVPAGDLRKAGNGNAWLLLRSAGECPGRAG